MVASAPVGRGHFWSVHRCLLFRTHQPLHRSSSPLAVSLRLARQHLLHAPSGPQSSAFRRILRFLRASLSRYPPLAPWLALELGVRRMVYCRPLFRPRRVSSNLHRFPRTLGLGLPPRFHRRPRCSLHRVFSLPPLPACPCFLTLHRRHTPPLRAPLSRAPGCTDWLSNFCLLQLYESSHATLRLTGTPPRARFSVY